jgi:hypothetical protein
MAGSNHGHVFQTSEEDARKGDVLGIFLTRPDIGDGSVALPWRSRDPSSTPRTPGRLGHGHSLPGPWPRRPRPFPRAPASPGPIEDRRVRRFGSFAFGFSAAIFLSFHLLIFPVKISANTGPQRFTLLTPGTFTPTPVAVKRTRIVT